MKQFSLAKHFSLMLLAILLLFSCTKDGEQDRSLDFRDDYFVGGAIPICGKLNLKYSGK